MAKRTDSHAPSALVTEDYEYVTGLTLRAPDPTVVGPNANGQWMTIPAESREAAAHRRKWLAILEASEAHKELGRCAHCGSVLNYMAVMLHKPTGQYLGVGETCLENRFSVATSEFRQMQKRAAEIRAQQNIRKAVGQFVLENPDLAWMASLEESQDKAGVGNREDRFVNWFILDVSHKLRRYGTISEKQANAVRASLAKDAEYQAARTVREAQRVEEQAAAQDVPQTNERIQIDGEVLSTKWQDGRYGREHKMLVKERRGFKLYGTVPSGIYDIERGAQVSFVASVQRSNDDPKFGFYSRPTKAAVPA